MDDRIERPDHLGVCRAICATPSIVGSVLVLAAGFGWLDEWANLVLAGWLLIALLLLSRPAERAAVTLAYGYRRLTPAECTLLAPAARDAMRRCGLPSNTVDFYLRWRVPGVNGFAAGRWSVAVSRGLVDALRHRTLSHEQAAAIVTHELGHHASGATRYALVVGWLTAPWRLVSGVVGALLRAIVRHVPTARAALLLAPLIAAVAVVQLVQHHAWLSLATLVGLFVVAVVQPVCDAAVSRASERAADRYTVSHGGGHDLARVLHTFPSSTPTGRLRSSHPDPARRMADLTMTPS